MMPRTVVFFLLALSPSLISLSKEQYSDEKNQETSTQNRSKVQSYLDHKDDCEKCCAGLRNGWGYRACLEFCRANGCPIR